MNDLNKLMTFVRVAQHGSFTKAARDLRMTSSVISKHIRELEDGMGLSLLNRSTRGVVLTEAGEPFFRTCAGILESLDKAVTDARSVQAGPSGVLRIHAAAGYARWILAPLFPRFIRSYPQLRIDIATESIGKMPRESAFDLYISSKSPPEPELIHRDIETIQHIVCASPAYFRVHGVPASPDDLRAHNCLVNSLFAPREWWFHGEQRNISVPVQGTFCSDSSAILTQAALEGVGIVKVPLYSVRSELAEGKLQAILEDETLSRENMRVYYPKSKYVPAKTAAFVDFLHTTLTTAAQAQPI